MIPFQDRLDRESFPYGGPISPVNATGTNVNTLATTTWTVNRNVNMNFIGQAYNASTVNANQIIKIQPNAGRVIYAPYLTVTFSTTVAEFTSLTVGVSSAFSNYTVVIPANVPVSIPNIKVYPGDFFILSTIGATNDTRYTKVVTDMVGSYDMTDDDRPSIKPVMRGYGDSITYGTGPIVTVDTWFAQLDRYFASRGYPLRMVNYGEPAKKSDQIAARARLGFYAYEADNVKVETLMIGTNNANIGTAITTAQLDQYAVDVNEFLADRQKLRPTSLLLVLGPPPVSPTFNQLETNLVAVRQRLRTVVNDYKTANPADVRIVFIDLGGSTAEWPTPIFDRTVAGNFSDGLHLSKLGSTAVVTRISTYLNANPTLVPNL